MQENIDLITQNRRAIREELEVNTAKAIKSKENKCTRLMRIMLTWSHLSKYWVNSSALNKIFGGHYTELELRCICFRCVCVCVCVCVFWSWKYCENKGEWGCLTYRLSVINSIFGMHKSRADIGRK